MNRAKSPTSRAFQTVTFPHELLMRVLDFLTAGTLLLLTGSIIAAKLPIVALFSK